MARITIPYAVADFAEMRERGFYYVDKTNYIPGLEDYNAPIFLRPRRFGKSLLISMLAHYYDRTKANRFEELFGGTWIGEHPTEEHNQYLVIRYDFSAMVMADDMEGVVQNFNDLNCGPVEVTVEHNRDLFGDFQFTTRGNAVQMLEELLGYISSHGLPKAYILIDEYDNFTNQLLTSYNDSLYEEVTTSDSFLLTFFKVIKAGIGEGTIRTCFCTGVLPVIMDDLTSGYNIAEILTFKPVFLNMLGFTYEETKTYLRYVLDKYAPGASEERFEEIWQLIVNNYDGYRFSPVGERLFPILIADRGHCPTKDDYGASSGRTGRSCYWRQCDGERCKNRNNYGFGRKFFCSGKSGANAFYKLCWLYSIGCENYKITKQSIRIEGKHGSA